MLSKLYIVLFLKSMNKFKTDSQTTYTLDELSAEFNEKYDIEILNNEAIFKLNKDANILSKGLFIYFLF